MAKTPIIMALDMECEGDDLSPAQVSWYKVAKTEHKQVTDMLNKLGNRQAKNLLPGEYFSLYEVEGKVGDHEIKSTNISKMISARKATATTNVVEKRESPSRKSQRKRTKPLVGLSSDEDYSPIQKRIKEKTVTKKPVKEYSTKSTLPITENTTKKTVMTSNVRPCEETSVGGLMVALAENNRTDDKQQGKTYPSLIVAAKPFLNIKESKEAVDRAQLDNKVKCLLVMPSEKFTEWLIQQGLLRYEQKCSNHPQKQLKLGVYSEASNFPYSGGYVWISSCCPNRFVSVFYGSLFENNEHPPNVLLKLIYHWACQTHIQNVVQWIKVDNSYIKKMYTFLRSICVISTQKHFKLMGGKDQIIEVGVISLGTTSQDRKERQVKVEVVGVLDSSKNVIKLRAVEPLNEKERSYKKRYAKTLEPLAKWIHKDSTLIIDMTIDKTILTDLGFKNVLQIPANNMKSEKTNANLMNYLRKIVPRMFQNTLASLSRQVIQQFLDELVWREQFGMTSLNAFDNIIAHIGEQSKSSNNITLMQRLYKVAANPDYCFPEYIKH